MNNQCRLAKEFFLGTSSRTSIVHRCVISIPVYRNSLVLVDITCCIYTVNALIKRH